MWIRRAFNKDETITLLTSGVKHLNVVLLINENGSWTQRSKAYVMMIAMEDVWRELPFNNIFQKRKREAIGYYCMGLLLKNVRRCRR